RRGTSSQQQRSPIAAGLDAVEGVVRRQGRPEGGARDSDRDVATSEESNPPDRSRALRWQSPDALGAPPDLDNFVMREHHSPRPPEPFVRRTSKRLLNRSPNTSYALKKNPYPQYRCYSCDFGRNCFRAC